MNIAKSVQKEREVYEKKQRERIITFRNKIITIPEWFEITAAECYNNTKFFHKLYGSISQTMQDHPSYRHLKGASINRGRYYASGNPVHLTNIASYLTYEFFLPMHRKKIQNNNPFIVSDFNKEKVPQKYFEKFFKKCLERHIEADDIYGELDFFLEKNPIFEHLENGWLRNRAEYQEIPYKQPLIDMANYIIYELRKPMHKLL